MENNKEVDVSRWVDEQLSMLNPDCEWQPDTTKALSSFGERTTRMNSNRHKLAWATLTVVVASGVLLAHPASRVFAQRCLTACRNLFDTSDDTGVASVLEAAPDFVLKDAAGNNLRLSDYRGKVVLLNFWATWCLPCQVEIPWFEEFTRTYADQGFEVVGVSMDEDGWKSVRPFMEKLKINYSVVLGDEDVAKQYGADSVPVTFLINREGRVAAKHLGIVNKSDYETEIVRLLEN
jgi:cytochrome c biogenesis protein CcmG/thiol:disulfide interchange protein DsbE